MTLRKPRRWFAHAKVCCTRLLLILAVAGAFATTPASGQQTPNEQVVWKLESSYWQDVKALDLDRYRDIWDTNFVGWPFSSSHPARKDHITDWITLYTAKGEKMQWFSLQPADSQATENLVVTHYWVTSRWVDKAGNGEPSTSRITHTWIKTAAGWKIISGMSALVPTN